MEQQTLSRVYTTHERVSGSGSEVFNFGSNAPDSMLWENYAAATERFEAAYWINGEYIGMKGTFHVRFTRGWTETPRADFYKAALTDSTLELTYIHADYALRLVKPDPILLHEVTEADILASLHLLEEGGLVNDPGAVQFSDPEGTYTIVQTLLRE